MTTARRPFAILASLLTLSLLPLASADPPSGDASNTANGALTVAPGTYSASLGTASDVDWYRVAVPTLTQTTVTVSCTSGGETIQLYQGDGTTLINSAACGGSVYCTSTFNYLVYVKVSGTAADTYSFTVSNGAGSLLGTVCNL